MKHACDPDRTAAGTKQWTECGQFVDADQIVAAHEVAACPMCAVVSKARAANTGAQRIKATYPALIESGVWRPKRPGDEDDDASGGQT